MKPPFTREFQLPGLIAGGYMKEIADLDDLLIRLMNHWDDPPSASHGVPKHMIVVRMCWSSGLQLDRC